MKTLMRGIIGLVLSLTFAAGSAFAATNYYVSTTGNDGNDGLTPGTAKLTIQAAVAVASATDIINVDAGTYNERVVLDKSLTLTGVSESMTVLDGAGLVGAGSGVTINAGITNVTIKDMTIRNYAGTSPNSFAGIYAIGSNNALAVQNVTLQSNVGGSGFYANGPVNGVTLNNLDVSGHTNAFGAARGIVIWNGLKENITITNCDVYLNNCCGIELQDGTASGVTMTNNNVFLNGDNGIGLVGLQGPGENLIKSNTLTNNGRFGIEVKNPNGSGLAAGPGRVVVENNTVSRTSVIADARDIVGIAAFRRGVLAGNVDVPNGVVIQNNIIMGYSQPSVSEGFGIVAEGTNHTVTGNTVSGCDIGVQRQFGHTPYPGDGNQNNIADQYFGRGNSPISCGITVGPNTLANTVNQRDVPVGAGNGAVVNANSLASFCSIQAAVNAASPGDVINVGAGTYNERVTIDKALTLNGASELTTILTGTGLAGAGSGIVINAGITNVTIQNMTVKNYSGTSPNAYAGIYGTGSNSGLLVKNVTIKDNVGGSGFYANGPVNGVTLDNLDVSGHTNAFGAARGIVIWNGLKQNISITNCDVYGNNCCGIELQDGTASGVTLTNNNIHDNGDNGIGLVGLEGPGENLIKLNTLTNNGRFGIELKNPNGSGLAAGAGRVVVENNTVSRTLAIVDARDIVGIAAFRRGVLAGNVDVPNGVVIQNNNVSGYVQASTSDGFGIVAEGTGHTVTGNTVSGCDVGIQRQYGHTPYPGDGDQSNLADLYFGRGNSPISCGITVSGNTLTNTVDTRDVPIGAGNGAVVNNNTLATYCSIQAAINAASAGDVLSAGAGTYNERVTIDKSLTLQGASEATTILDGTGLAGPGSGIIINAGLLNVTIRNLTVRNYAGTAPNSYAGIYASGGNNGLVVENVTLKDNVGGCGFFGVGPVNGVTLNNLEVSGHTNVFGAARGIVIWDGLKQNITITNCDVYGNNCCGIELQDGTATGVTLTNNNVHDNGDNGIGLIGLEGPGENLVKLNTVANNGRFGIEIKNPNGSGLAAGAGRVVVEDNTVSRTLAIVDARDIAGIAAFRRGVLAGNVDVPFGVVIRNNNVSGYVQPSTSEGFGIVAEGINHKVTGNTVSGCDVGIQRQFGHTPYPGDGNQNDMVDTYFGRGNSPVSCGIEVSGNTLTNTIDTRDVPLSAGGSGVVVNTTTLESFCTIQAAINDANTLNGHTLEVGSGNYDEQVLVNKSVTIKGVGAPLPTVNFTGVVSGNPTLFFVSSDAVTIESMHFNVDLAKLKSAIIVSDPAIDNITIKDNIVDAYGTPSAGTYGNRNAISINYGGPTNYRTATAGVDNIVFTGNVVNGSLPASFFRSAVSVDEGGGTFSGNTSQTINHDVLVRFGSNGPITITNNQLNGGGVELAEMNAGAGTLTVSNNTFNAAFANSSAPGTAVLRLKNNNAGKTTIVDGNTFMSHQWAVSTENYNNVTISNNLMTPLAGSTTFHHVTVNTKSISTNSATIVQTPVAAQITNNFFNGSGSSGGSGVTFLNHDSDAAAFGALEVHQNSFDFSIANAIEQDGQSGNSTGSTFPNYNALIGAGAGAQTTMAPWTATINGTCNWYGTTNAAAIASRVGPNVTEVPFLASGVDDQPGTFGFQPVVTTTTTLVSDNNPATFGTKILFTATVTPAVESGTIQLFDGAISLGTQNAVGGEATFSVDTLHNGNHTITAVYSGDACYPTSTSDPLAQVVVDQTNPVANVTLPTTNDVLVVGSHAKIQWTASDDKGVESVSIILSRDNGATWEDIVLDIANTGTYTWLVTGPPTGVTATPVYSAIIQVKAKDAAGNIGTGTSGTFAIYDLTTDALLSTFQADPVEEGIELRWQFGSTVSISGVTLERGSSTSGPWRPVVAEARNVGGMTVVVDRTAELGQTYFYRLQVSLPSGQTISFGPLAGTLGDRVAAFALTSITPNPTVDFARIDYAVPRESRVRLSVIDVQGREVALLVDGVVRAGRFQTTWNGQLQSGVAAPAGLYFVRMNSGGKDYVRRLALSR